MIVLRCLVCADDQSGSDITHRESTHPAILPGFGVQTTNGGLELLCDERQDEVISGIIIEVILRIRKTLCV